MGGGGGDIEWGEERRRSVTLITREGEEGEAAWDTQRIHKGKGVRGGGHMHASLEFGNSDYVRSTMDILQPLLSKNNTRNL